MSTPAFRDRALARLLPFGPVQARAMFGGYGLYVDGVMFALIARDRLFFTADRANRSNYQAPGTRPFTYDGKNRPVEMSYWEVPPAVFDDPLRLADWARRAHAAARRAKASGAPRRLRATR